MFSLTDYEVQTNATYEGQSGIRHQFQMVIISKKNQNMRIAVLFVTSDNMTNDIMLFNSKTSDCGISLKAIVTNRDLNKIEENLVSMYKIRVLDTRRKEEPPPSGIFGIDSVDRRVGGSMKRGNVYMISGKAGVGKTTSSTHFLVQGARMGEKGAIILTDMRPAEYISNAKSFSFHFGDYYDKGLIDVMELSDQIREMKYDILEDAKDQRKFITKMATEIRKAVVSSKISRLVIDPITPMLIENEDFINTLLNSLAIPDTFVIVTSGVRHTDLSVYGIEEYYVSGIIKIEYADENNYLRKLSIAKMRGGPYDPSPFYFKITGDGIVPANSDETGSYSVIKRFRG